MGTLETTSRVRRKRENIQHAVLSAIAVAGIIGITMIAPGIAAAVPALMGRKRFALAFQAKTVISRLKLKGYIRFVERDGKRYVELTEAGQRYLAIEIAKMQQSARKKQRWDGRYRVVMFDIPQRRRAVRDALRGLMRAIGFLRIQDSVWLSPYDCEELVALIKAELHVGRDVVYAIVDSLENDAWIRKHFDLPSNR